MSSLVGEVYDSLADGLPWGQGLFNELLKHLTTDSFNIPPNNEHIHTKLRDAMGLFATRLHETVISLKMVDDVSKMVGVTLSGHSNRRDDEIRVIFEAAVMLLLYVGIRKGVYKRSRCIFYKNYEDLSAVYDRTVPGFEDTPTTPTATFTNSSSTIGTGSSIIDNVEKKKLVLFANMMKTVLLLVHNPKGKRAFLIDIVTKISEGSNCYELFLLCMSSFGC
jgi:hypothetical protein